MAGLLLLVGALALFGSGGRGGLVLGSLLFPLGCLMALRHGWAGAGVAGAVGVGSLLGSAALDRGPLAGAPGAALALGAVYAGTLAVAAAGAARLRRTHAAASAEAALAAEILAEVPAQVALFDEEGRYLYTNPPAVERAEVREWLRGRTDLDFCRERGYPLEVGERRQEALQRCLREGRVVSLEESFPSKRDGRPRHFLRVLRAVPRPDGRRHVIGYGVDVTEQKEAHEALRRSEQKLSLHFHHTPLAVIGWDADLRVTEWNPAAEQIFGYPAAEALGRTAEFITAEAAGARAAHVFAALLERTGGTRATLLNRRRDGTQIHAEWYNTALVDEVDRVVGITSLVEDVSERVRAQERLGHEALHDMLTGLPNRALFVDRLGAALERGKRRADYLFAVLFIDLDRFKVINDSLGHLLGDRLLTRVAQALRACVRPADTVARIGGDEFAVLTDELGSEGNVSAIVQRIQEALGRPFDLEGQEVYTSASVGVALSSQGYRQPEDFLRDADTAMYRAKEGGRARVEVFQESMRSPFRRQLQLETELRYALERDELVLHYQPILRLSNDEISGFEVLVRWNHPQRGLLPPGEFLPAAEESGLVIPLDRAVLRRACRDLADPQVPERIWLNVNVSARNFLEPDLPDHVAAVLKETGLPARRLKLEVTETVIINKPESAAAILRRLKELGVQVCLDDFGTGYSSLSYLLRFPVDVLKIDRSFVQAMGPDWQNAEIVQAILSLARSLGITVVAEGVETSAQLDALKTLGCDGAQGYYIARPVDSEHAWALLRGPGEPGEKARAPEQ
jgi:Amt family ammonium transporter